MSKKKTKEELDADLQLELDKSDSWEGRLELLLVAILRELKRIK